MRHMCVMAFSAALAVSTAAGATETADELGGNIVVWPKDPGKFLFVNSQKRLAGPVLEKPVDWLRAEFAIDIRMVDGKFPDVRAVPATLEGLDAKGAIWIVDDLALPVSLVAADNGWGILNIAPLLADSPDAANRDRRIAKFLYRTFASLHGIGDSVMMPACVMKHAVGIDGVDGLACATYSPEACSKIRAFLSLAGYKSCRAGTYYDACEEGWAPRPTNAVQKAIWDKVHQLPTKPLTIQRESSRREERR